jgi:hypothetical protein
MTSEELPELPDELYILVQAKYIPSGATVSMATGEKLYTLVDKLKIFHDSSLGPQETGPSLPKEIKIETGRILVPKKDTATATLISPKKLLKWHVAKEDLVRRLTDEIDGSVSL